MVGSREQVAGSIFNEWHLLVSIVDPPPGGTVATPAPGSAKLLGSLELAFADLDPADCQATWKEPIVPYGRPAEELIMTRETGKKLWSFLLRRRQREPELIVLQDDGDGRALSLAYAIADALRLARSQAVANGNVGRAAIRSEESARSSRSSRI